MTSHLCYKKMTLNETLFEDLLYLLTCFGKKTVNICVSDFNLVSGTFKIEKRKV